MGRGKLQLELIQNKRTRNSTFQKRKESLMKKLREFTTLCDVEACMILHGPCEDGTPTELATWPENHDEVRRIISKYKSKSVEERTKENHNLSDFFKKRNHEVNDDLVKTRRANVKAKYPWIYSASEDNLKNILKVIDSKIEYTRVCMTKAKENQMLINEKAQKRIGYTSYPNYNINMQGLYPGNMLLEENPEFQETKPLDFSTPQNHMFDHGFYPGALDISYQGHPTMEVSGDCHVGSTSTANIQYTQLIPSICFEQNMNGKIENNEMYSNNYPRPLSYVGGYYSNPTMQHQVQPQYMQFPEYTNNASSQAMMMRGYYSNPSMLHQVQPQYMQLPEDTRSASSQVLMMNAPSQMNDDLRRDYGQ